MTRLYSTFDPAALGASLALEQANTVVYTTAVGDINRTVRALYGKSGYSWFVEFAAWGDGTIANLVSLGLVNDAASLSTYVGGDANGWGYRLAEGQIHNNGASTDTVTAGAKGDIVGVWLDVPDGATATATWFLNGEAIHSETLPDTGPWYPAASIGTTDDEDVMRVWINGGQRDFEFPVPGVDGWYEFPPDVPTLRIATRDYIAPPSDPIPNAVWEGRISEDSIEIVQQLVFWPDGGRSTQGSAVNVTVANGDGALDGWLDLDARELPVSLQRIQTGYSILDATDVAEMLVDDVIVQDDGSVRFTFTGGMQAFDAPLQSRIFPPSADPVVAGKPFPILLGAARSVTPTLVDPVNRIYQVSDAGLPGWGWVRDKGAPLDPNDIPPGYVINPDGSITLETDAIGKLTVDASSTGGGTLPTLADDIWLGYGNPFTGSGATLLNFDQQSGASFQALSNAVLTSSSLLSRPYFALSTATMDAGRSYRYRINLGNLPPNHSFGQPAVSLSTPTGIPIAVMTAPGIYEGVFTATSTFVPRVQMTNALTGTTATIRQAFILEIPDDYDPAVLQAITLTEFVQEIVEGRFGLPPSAWSRADTEAIDLATGYAGIGFFASESMTVRQALDAVLDSYTACAWVDEQGVLRFTRLTPPEDEVPVGEITGADLLADIQVRPDLAPALTTQIDFRKNWTVLNDTDFVTDFVVVPMAVRSVLTRTYQGIVASAIPLSATYANAVNAEPMNLLLDVEADAQAEVNHVTGYYSTLRKFYTTEVSAELGVQIGQVWTLRYPRYGLDAGKNLLVSRVSRRIGSETVAITLRG